MAREQARSSWGLWEISLVACLCGALASDTAALRAAWHWPMVGDAALMRYAVLLQQTGKVAYSQVIDVNLPGTYLLELMAMRVCGSGVHGLRLYDATLCLLTTGLCVILSESGWRSRLSGAVAGLLFLLVHLRDGVMQAGQRDFALAVLLLVALALYLRCRWLSPTAALLAYEFVIGLTLTIKPTLFLLALVPFVQTGSRARGELLLRRIAGSLAVLLLPWCVTVAWLHGQGALFGFWQMLRWIEPAHRALAHQSLVFLIAHAGAPLWALLGVGIVLSLRSRTQWKAETQVLVLALLCGLVSFVLQAKGFSYQRYPFLVVALLLVSRSLARTAHSGRLTSALSAVVLLVVGCGVMPRYAATVSTFDKVSPFDEALAGDLTRLQARPGEVQCLDTVGGCIATLYRLRLPQSTGFLYDCYAYEGTDKQVFRYRQQFLGAMVAARPRLLVLDSHFCLEPHGNLQRIDEWAALREWLDSRYVPAARWSPTQKVHWWRQPELPPSYVLYARRP